ncbi:HAD-IC family P-type ATPase [Alteromonas sp. C1M14]|nr:HAD-IC family P-type ATPase [Alteromonas sp. C1M14]
MESKTHYHWHDKTSEEVLNLLDASKDGLTEKEAAHRKTKYGPNRLPEAPHASLFSRFIKQFANLLVIVLIVAGIMTAFLQHWVDTAVIFAVVVVNAIIGVVQEGKAEKAMDSIRQMLALKAAVYRGGRRQTIDGEDLVPGDIVMLEAGDKVPADIRIIKAHSLFIQESLLTGESLPVEKNIRQVENDTALGDRTCLAFSGTTVTAGQGMGVVVSTGEHTEIGQIGGMLSDVQKLTTPLVEQMDVLAKWITVFILVVAVILLGVGTFILDQPFADLFLAVVGLSVAAIPEGLPAVLTITLAVGVQAMAKRNAIVRVLPAIETLGSVSVICSDKTGTFTRNEMLVSWVNTADETFSVEGEGYEPEGKIRLNEQPVTTHHSLLNDIASACALCNDAEINNKDGEWITEGDPMEGALLSFSQKVAFDEGGEYRKHWSRTDVLPFDSDTQYMATLNHDHAHHHAIFVKGAPEVVINKCDSQRTATGDANLDTVFWQEKAESMAKQGLRVLALAIKPMPEDANALSVSDLDEGLCLLGLVGLIDPPRQEAIEAVKKCQQAHVQVKMITGDHAITAQAIGLQLGLAHADTVLTGAEINTLSDEELKHAVQQTDVFARTTPEHKLRLVMALQALGLTVSMTGDGVNDAPSLKRADAGVAMGLKGSEAAKEAAEVVLADDNFASIASAVEQGRTVYANIKKVVSWTLPTNAGEALTIIVALLAGLPYPITPVQILWVNMITAVTLGMALAFEPTDSNTMKKPPRRRGQALIQPALVWQILLVGTLFFLAVFGIYQFAVKEGHDVEYARTQAMNMLVGLEIFYLFFIRTMHRRHFTLSGLKGTKIAWSAVIFVIVAQFAISYIPWLQAVFGTQAPTLMDNLLIVLAGCVLFALLETEKVCRIWLIDKMKRS